MAGDYNDFLDQAILKAIENPQRKKERKTVSSEKTSFKNGVRTRVTKKNNGETKIVKNKFKEGFLGKQHSDPFSVKRIKSPKRK